VLAGIVFRAMRDTNVHRDWLAFVITLVCSLVAVVFCLVNIVRVALWREMKASVRVGLMLLNMSFPVAFALAYVYASAASSW
jgi:hypothetical protein